MSRNYIIDGYNVLHAVPSLEEVLQADVKRARKELETLVNLYTRTANVSATVVYDSRSVPDAFDDFQDSGQPMIVYTGSGKTADDYIIDEAENLRSPDVTVVTRDRNILARVRRTGCDTMTPERFINMILRIPRGRKGATPRKFQTEDLSRAEIKEWLDVFTSEDDQRDKS